MHLDDAASDSSTVDYDQTTQRFELESESEPNKRCTSRLAFWLAAIGCASGFGSLWRFPYICYDNGGAIFFVPYLVCVFGIVLPLIVCEFGLGQLFQGGSVKAAAAIDKKYAAVGLSCFASFNISNFYTLLHSICLYYLVNCFYTPLPWTLTESDVHYCAAQETEVSCMYNDACKWTGSICSASILHKVMNFLEINVSAKLDYRQGIAFFNGWIFLAQSFTWASVFFFTVGGARILGYVNFLTTGGPMVILFVLVILVLSLPGSSMGIKYYLGNINFSTLVNGRVWVEALGQAIFSLGAVQGTIAAYAAYSSLDHNFVKDALVVSLGDIGFSFTSGLVVFTIAGYLAASSNMQMEDLPFDGPRIAFQTYTIGVAAAIKSPLSNIILACFFIIMWCMGVSTSIGHVETVCSNIVESRWYMDRFYLRWICWLAYCFVCWIISIIYSTDMGFSIMETMNIFNANVAMVYIMAVTSIVMSWCVGEKQHYKKVGRLAVELHRITWLTAAVIGSFLMHVALPGYKYVGACIWGLIAVTGFMFALKYTKKMNCKGTLYSTKERIHNLTLCNIELFRKFLNKEACCNSRIRLPFIWSIILKYFVTSMTILCFMIAISDPRNSYGYPDRAEPQLPWVFLVATSGPILLMVAITFFLICPWLFESWLPYDEHLMGLPFEPKITTKKLTSHH